MEANSIESGNTNGTIRGMENARNLIIINRSKSLPANSDMNNQTV